MSNDRWYLKPNDAIKIDRPGDFIDESQAKEDATYYKVVVQMSQDEIKNFSGKPVFDPSFFDDFAFVDSLKYSIAEQYLNAAYGPGTKQLAWDEDYNIPFEQYSAENKEKLISSAFITKKFHIETGSPGIYYFLGLFGLGPAERAIIKNTEAGVADEVDEEEETFQQVEYEKHQEDLSKLKSILQKAKKSHDQLEQQYRIDLDTILQRIVTYKNLLKQRIDIEDAFVTDVIDGKITAISGFEDEVEANQNAEPGEGKQEEPLPDVEEDEPPKLELTKDYRTRLLFYRMEKNKSGPVRPKRILRYYYTFHGDPIVGQWVLFNRITTNLERFKRKTPKNFEGPPAKPAAEWPEDVWAPWNPVDFLSPVKLNSEYDTEAINLIYNIDNIIKEYEGKSVNADQFIKKYIKPVPQLRPKSIVANAVFNAGEVVQKTIDQVGSELLSDAQKAKIHNEVKLKYYNTSDLAFLNMLKQAQSMKTLEDVYEMVLNAIPLDSLVPTVVECLMKAMHLSELKSIVCDIILENINEEEINKVLQYLETSTSDIAGLVKEKIASLTAKHTAGSGAVGSFLVSGIQGAAERDMLCLAIFSAIPLAAAMLAGFEKELGITNPADAFMAFLEKKINMYSITGITEGWRMLIIEAIISFLDEFITQTIVKLCEEISYLCEGSAAADMAGMPVGELPPSVNGTPPTMPFTPFSLPEAIPNEDPESVMQDMLAPFGDPDNRALIDNLKLFLDALGDFLTVSEICTLISSDANPVNKKYILNKVFDGLLSLEKFSILREAVNSIAKLEKLFFILGSKISDDYCVKKTLALDAAKKVLSTFCGPASNAALIEDLKNKATQDAIDALLDQERDIKKDLVKGIANISDLTRVAPELFCGPDSQNSGKTPIFPSHQHDSEKYLAGKTMKKTIRGIDKQYNQDLALYKGVFLSSMDDVINISGKISGAMAAVFALNDSPTSPPSSTHEPSTLKNLKLDTNANKLIAQKVYDAVTKPDSISVNTNLINNMIAISSKSSQIALFFNYSDVDETGVPPKSAALTFNLDKPAGALEDLSKEVDNYENIINQINTFDSKNYYDTLINENVTTGLGFYGYLLKQVLTEHMEYISQQDLFKRENFTKLQLTSQESLDPCEISLLDPAKLVSQLEDNIKALECKKDFSDIPSAFEVAQINMFVEILYSTLIAQEFLKSIFVLSAFNLDALLPEDKELSFYYDYLRSRIDNKINSFNKKYSTINLNLDEIIAKYSTQVYAAKKNLDFSNTETYANQARLDIFHRNYSAVRDIFAKKLKASGYNTPAASSIGEEFTTEDPENSISKQVLKNIVSDIVHSPPTITQIDYSEKKIFVKKGTYSSDSRLVNGGFFIEKGYDVVPRYKYDENGVDLQAITKETWDKSAFSKLFTELQDTPPFPKYLEKIFNIFSPDIFVGPDEVDILSYPLYYFDTDKSKLASDYISNGLGMQSLKYFNSIGKISKNTFQAKYEFEISPETTIIAAVGNDGLKEFMNIIPKVYKKYADFYTLNILLRVSDAGESKNFLGETVAGTGPLGTFSLGSQYKFIKQLAPSVQPYADWASLGFHDAVLDKKYFIQEEDGTLYFKLPLITFEKGDGGGSFASFRAFNFKDLLSDNETINEMSLTDDFKNLISTINYKDLLSYLAIVTADVTKSQYPALDNVFTRTILTVINTLNPLLAVANRQTDPDFYKTSNFTNVSTGGVPGSDWLPMIMKAFLETIANMVDPTWRTEWFLPGPLTPFGMAAKLLEGVNDGEGDENTNALESATEETEEEECLE